MTNTEPEITDAYQKLATDERGMTRIKPGKVQICCLSSYRRSSVATQPQNGASLSKIEKDLTAAAGYIVRELRHVRTRFESRQLKTEKLYYKGERGAVYATRR